jgi:hypothetical protein
MLLREVSDLLVELLIRYNPHGIFLDGKGIFSLTVKIGKEISDITHIKTTWR